MRILVTGGTGFIGSNLISELIKRDHEVYNLERYVTGRHILPKPCPTLFADLRDGFVVKKVVREIDPEVVIHMAAISAVSYSYDHPQEVIEANLIGTINLAESSLRDAHCLRQFLFAGTSEEYGNNGASIQREDSPLMPASPYAVSKVACERYLNYMAEAYAFPVTVLRPFNTYGRTSDNHFLIERAIVQMLSSGIVNLIDPTPVRDWLYVHDHVSAYLSCLGNKTAIGETYNFCTGKGHSIKETIELIAALTQFKGIINWGSAPKRPTESKVIVGDNNKARRILGWQPKYSLEDGLKPTIEYWKSKLTKQPLHPHS